MKYQGRTGARYFEDVNWEIPIPELGASVVLVADLPESGTFLTTGKEKGLSIFA